MNKEVESFLAWLSEQELEDKHNKKWNDIRDLIIDPDDSGEDAIRVHNHRQLYNKLERAISEAVESQRCNLAYRLSMCLRHLENTLNKQDLVSYKDLAIEFAEWMLKEHFTPRCSNIYAENIVPKAEALMKQVLNLQALDRNAGNKYDIAKQERDRDRSSSNHRWG